MPEYPLHLDLYGQELILAAPEPRRLREASVEFGRPTVRRMGPAEPTALSSDGSGRLLLVQFPFDLETPPANRWYEAATVTVEFADESVTAMDIRPSDVDRTVSLDVRGLGRNRLAWDLSPAEGEDGLRPRSHVMQVVVEMPAVDVELSGVLAAEATIRRRRMGVMDRIAVSSIDPVPFSLGPIAAVAEPAAAPVFSGPVKVEVCRRLGPDWRDLADYVGVPVARRATFERGREAQEVWDWLEERGRLGELSAALRKLDRADLAELLGP